ncbi:MAG: hypothetical protein QNJ11_20145 [Woeseiaceae bacterium]|nr:hypothetical protein [Woeseiaceae bacterium]
MKELLNGLLLAIGCVITSCLVSTMALFIADNQQGADLKALMYLQAASVPLALSITAFLLIPVERQSVTQRLKVLYCATPQWLIFSAILLNSLVASGEVALIVVAIVTDVRIPWTSHVPLMSMLVSSLAYCLLSGQQRLMTGHRQALSGRWAP